MCVYGAEGSCGFVDVILVAHHNISAHQNETETTARLRRHSQRVPRAVLRACGLSAHRQKGGGDANELRGGRWLSLRNKK
jgi:hypothetical protein